MLVSGILRITLLSCLVLSVALFLPKLFLSAGKEKVVLQSEAVGPGSLPALRYGHGASAGDDQWTPGSFYTRSQTPQTFSPTKTSRKSSLLAQITPIYGFGIFLYIVYIFYKLTREDRATNQTPGSSTAVPEHTAQEMPEDEMVHLQTRLQQMEGQRERRTSKSVQSLARCRNYRSGRETRKLQHLRKITHMLVEGRPLEDVTPEVEAEETPYSADWEGYPEETFPRYEVPLCRRRYPSVILEEPYGDVPSPEELAERIEREDEEDEKNEEETEEVKDKSSEDEDGPKGMKGDGELKQTHIRKGEETDDNEDDADEEDYKQDEEEEEEVGEDQPCLADNSTDEEETPNLAGNQNEGETSSRRRQITFSNHRHIFHYPKGGAVGCSYEDEEVEEDTPEDDSDGDDDDDDDVEEDKWDEDDDLNKMEMEEDNPLMEAERLDFSTQFTCDPEDQEVDLIDFLLTYKPEAVMNSEQSGEAPGLRMRCKNMNKGKPT
ncbi:protein RIC-3 [Ictalurus punctatus]|uniref:Protein RIC-3 n=1 Tax=Ictalurus punctatus TaxID=7998 RepID=A0A9F7R5A7_ICTPU|nr:protein RIC-3 [Ictalurus punctatus]